MVTGAAGFIGDGYAVDKAMSTLDDSPGWFSGIVAELERLQHRRVRLAREVGAADVGGYAGAGVGGGVATGEGQGGLVDAIEALEWVTESMLGRAGAPEA